MVEVERGQGSLLGDAGFAAASHTIVESAGGALAGAAAGVGGSGGALANQRRRHAMLPYSDSFRVRDEWGEQLSEHEWAAIARGGGVRTATEIAGLGSTFQPAMPLAPGGGGLGGAFGNGGGGGGPLTLGFGGAAAEVAEEVHVDTGKVLITYSISNSKF